MRNGHLLEAAVLDKLATALAHRGPDGNGRYVNDAIGLVHTRLAIIDLETGDQPFEDPQGAVLIANGEIYNDLEIRRLLADAPYISQSDNESPLHLYRRKGLDFVDHLRGMYAIALYDKKTRRLILSRDPFGIKQLYYVATRTHFAFASEPQALIAADLLDDCQITAGKRAELLQLKFTTGEDTIFSGIRRVLPGETLVIADGKIVERRYRRTLPDFNAPKISYQDAAKRLDEVLTESVTLHVRSDVPYGLFLSGGIDSSVLATLMSRISSTPVIALTASFPDSKAADESAAAKRLAMSVGAEHHMVEITRHDFWNRAPRLVEAIDDPTADAAVLPTFMLGSAARSHNLKVVLSGEGADEVFGGYSRYRRTSWLWRLLRRKSRTRGVFGKTAGGNDIFNHWRDGLNHAEERETGNRWSHMQKLQAIDCAEWLPNDLLVKLDRCLMIHGVEGRVPFLDEKVAGFAFSLPDDMKVRGKFGKWLLRDWLSNNMPVAEAWTKKKGFNPPVGEWIDFHKEKITPLVLSQPGIAEMSIEDLVRKVFADPVKHSQAAWSLLFYSLWHSRHIIGIASNGSIGDVLTVATRLR